MDDTAHILAGERPHFEPMDPVALPSGRIVIDRKNPERAAAQLGLSARDSERFIEWMGALNA